MSFSDPSIESSATEPGKTASPEPPQHARYIQLKLALFTAGMVILTAGIIGWIVLTAAGRLLNDAAGSPQAIAAQNSNGDLSGVPDLRADRRLLRLRRIVLVTGAGLVVIGVAFSIVLAGRFLNPTPQQARSHAAADAEGNSDPRSARAEKDEIATMAAAFAGMSDALARSCAALERHVDNRTKQIAQQNEELTREITERAHAEQTVRESERRFRTMAETIPALVAIFQGTRQRYANRAAETMTGYSRDQLLEMAFLDLVHPDFRELVGKRSLARQRGEDVPARYEMKIVTRTGEERWIDFSAAVIEYEGEPAVLGVAIDITDRKRAQDAARGGQGCRLGCQPRQKRLRRQYQPRDSHPVELDHRHDGAIAGHAGNRIAARVPEHGAPIGGIAFIPHQRRA